MNAARPVLAGAIVAVLVTGIAVAVIRPGDLGGDDGLDAAAPTTTTTLAGAGEAAPPEGTGEPGTTAPDGAGTDGDGAEATPPVPPGAGAGNGSTTAPAPGPTAAPAPPSGTATPDGAPTPSPAPGPDEDPGPAPTLADTGSADGRAPLAVALLLASAGAWRVTRPNPESAA